MPRITHFEIHAGDPERAIAFYTKVFSWHFEKAQVPMPYWLVSTGPDSEPGINGGLMPRQGEVDGQAVIAYVCTASVDDVDRYAQSAVEAGGEIVVPKMAIRGVGWLVYCKDTEGNIFGLHQEDPAAA